MMPKLHGLPARNTAAHEKGHVWKNSHDKPNWDVTRASTLETTGNAGDNGTVEC